jgi:hypothetical protein
MHNNSFFKPLLFSAITLFFISCDKEYSTVGDALIGENNFELVKYDSNVIAHNEKVSPVQSNNLPVNALGIYDNPAFGTTTAHFATQITLASINPTINPALNQVIDSVMIDIPYFSTVLSTDVNGNRSYVLNSIYGDPTAKVKLSIYESGLYMGRQSGLPQIFYTNQNAEFDKFKKGNRLNDDTNKAQNDEFFFNPNENRFTATSSTATTTITRTEPSMRLKLNTDFFKDKILNAPAGSLATNDVFINYFKGLYFKVEKAGSDKGSLAMINFAKGTITIKYKENSTTTPVTIVEKSLVLNMTGDASNQVNTVSLLEQSNLNTNYNTVVSNPNRILGDEKLYLKGGEGSLAVINLFEKKDLIGYDTNGKLTGPNGVSDELDKIKNERWLINEAKLVFNVDPITMANSSEPLRIYLYDYTNNSPIIEYDLEALQLKPNKEKKVYYGDLIKSTDTKKGVNYSINITNHIRNLVKFADVKNVQLGVVVTENSTILDSYVLKSPSVWISEAPKATVMNPLGTVVLGGRSTSNLSDKKLLKLEIYYTKPK